MAVLHNNTARLLVGLKAKGQTPRWLPGRNLLDPEYWEAVKKSAVMKSWLSGKEPMIRVEMDGEMPDPDKPPTPEELSEFSLEDLRKALADRDVPVQWHPTLEQELAKREKENLEKRLPKAPIKKPKAKLLARIAKETNLERLAQLAEDEQDSEVYKAIDARIAELEADGG